MSFITLVQGSSQCHLTPLFLVHAVSGLAAPYSRLGPLTYATVPLSSDEHRAVYGISSPLFGSRNGFSKPRSLEAYARFYVTTIRKKQPFGPYLLGGWSMGGMLATKMAEILINDCQEQVLKVIVIDGANPEKLPPMTDEEGLVMGDENFVRNLNFASKRVAPAQRRMFLSVQESMDSNSSSDVDASGSELLSPLEAYLIQIRAHIALGLGLMSTVPDGSYIRPKSSHNIHITLIKCVEEEHVNDGQFGAKGQNLRSVMSDDRMGWDAQLFASLEIVLLVGATHDTCFEEPHAGKLTSIVGDCLRNLD